MKVYYEDDADLGKLQDKTLGIIGYGSQGHAQAQNLKESGVNVIISELPDTPNYKKAREDGFNPVTAAELAQKADIIQILAPDEIQKDIYEKSIKPYLGQGKALVFSHGFNIHYKRIIPPDDVDVYMVAPKAPGHTVRREYVNGNGVPALIAVFNNASGQAKEMALAHAKGIGSTKVGVLETSFREETETDLFGEQTVLCGGLTNLVRTGFETLVEAGYSPEMAYFECLHEVKLIVDLMYEGGIQNMRYSISDTAEYGDYAVGKDIITDKTRKAMQKALKRIQNGKFAAEFIKECENGKPKMAKWRQEGQEHQIEQVGAKLREMMKTLFKDKMVK
ncbi:MAG TPA: ketol-acid reductoisomerase [Spirochaetota bacterium]|nr:ketol-acid reductoisomerase [Spirochaetota bacterium]